MGAVKFSDRDLGMKSIRAELKRLARTVVTVGVHGTGVRAKDESGASVTVRPQKSDDGKSAIQMPMLATIHEFGSEKAKIPERSFMRSGIAKNRPAIMAAMETAGARVAAGEATAAQGMALVGVVATSAIKAQIMSGIAPGLAESTKLKRLRRTKAGRKLVNAAGRASRSMFAGASKGRFAKWTRATFGTRSDGTHGHIAGSWSMMGKRAGKRHIKALAALSEALSGDFTPLVDTGQLVGSIAYRVDTHAASKGGR